MDEYIGANGDFKEASTAIQAAKHKMITRMHDMGITRYWSKKLDEGFELQPEGKKLVRMKKPKPPKEDAA